MLRFHIWKMNFFQVFRNNSFRLLENSCFPLSLAVRQSGPLTWKEVQFQQFCPLAKNEGALLTPGPFPWYSSRGCGNSKQPCRWAEPEVRRTLRACCYSSRDLHYSRTHEWGDKQLKAKPKFGSPSRIWECSSGCWESCSWRQRIPEVL